MADDSSLTEEEKILAKKGVQVKPNTNVQPTPEERDPPIDFSHDILAVKKELGIIARRGVDQSESDNDRVFCHMLNKDLEKLRARKNNYAQVSKVYIEKRMKDAEYVKMNYVQTKGSQGNTEEIAQITSEISWRASSKPKGILHKKRYITWKSALPEGPSAEEIMYHRNLRSAKLLWKQIQADSVPDDSAEGQAEEEAREKRVIEQAKAHLKEQNEDHIKWGRFEKLRTKPTRLEFKKSLTDWAKSIFKMGRWVTEEGFPSQTGIDSNVRPSEVTIKDEIEYNRYDDDSKENRYVDKLGDIHRAFAEYMIILRADRAERFLEEERRKKEKAEQERHLREKMLIRKKKREEAQAKEEARLKAEAEELERRRALDKERRQELLIVASQKIAQDALDTEEAIAKKTQGRKLAWIKPKKEPKTVEDLIDELLETEKSAERKRLEDAEKALADAEKAFRKTWKGKLQTSLENMKGLSTLIRGPTDEEREQLELDRIEAEMDKEKAAEEEKNELKVREKVHEGVDYKSKKDRSKSMKSRKGAIKKPKGIWGHVKRIIFAPLGFLGVDEPKESKIERRNRKLKQKASIDKFKSNLDKKIVDTIFLARKKQKAAQGLLKGMSAEYEYERMEFFLPDLLSAARAGDYNKCIDIMEHPNTPISPNEYAEDDGGVSATYVACMKFILGQDSDNKEDKKAAALIDGKLTMYQKFIRKMNKNKSDAKLDWTVKVLLHKGGDIDFVKSVRDEEGLGLMHVAAEKGLKTTIEWLLNKKADPNTVTSRYKKSPLMFAAEHDMMDCMMVLLRNGAMPKINYQDKHGNTALHYCAIHGKPEYAQALMLCGATPKRNKIGRTPMEEAKSRNRMEMYEKLLYFKENDDEHVQRLLFLEKIQEENMSEVHSDD